MATSKRSQILEKLIKAGSEGCKFDTIQNDLKVTRTALFNHIHRLRKKHQIKSAGSVYTYITQGKEATKVVNTYKGDQNQEIISYMTNTPDGVGASAETLCQTFNLTKSALFSRIHYLRATKGYNITLKNGLYLIKPGSSVKTPSKGAAPELAVTSDINLKELLGNISMKDLNNLDKTVRDDCIDALRKAMFFRKSAEVIIQANKLILNITE